MEAPGWRDYFSFKKKERTGVIVFLLLIIILIMLPRLFPLSVKSSSKNSFDQFEKEIAEFESQQTDSSAAYDENVAVYHEPSIQYINKSVLFEFDPNTITSEQWKKLGVRDKTIKTIENYLAKGGRFKKPEDLAKIYGLRKDEFARLMPYVKIADFKTAPQTEFVTKEYTNKKDEPPANRLYKTTIIEINKTDTSELIALPGIGNKLANRIINFRDKLGGFYSVDQIKDTYGLPDSTFQTIKHRLKCDEAAIKRINVNLADANQLKEHPYIKWNIANAIVNYRKQHGDFKTINDLSKIDIITPQQLEKLSYYLIIE